MATIKVSALTAKTTSAGSEELLINDGGVSKKITIANLRSTSDIKTSVEAATDIALGGSPTTTTQSASDNSTKVATTAYADTAVANLVDSAPATLNTLDELAAALGDDANYAATITTALGTKAALAGATFTGAVTATTFNGANLAHTDYHNLGLGDSAIAAITTGDNNIGVGINTLTSTTTGSLNIAVGRNALLTNITGGNNTALGGDALRHTTTSNNTGVGYDALEANTSGTENIALGAFAGDEITTGSNNTIIGHYAGTAALADTVVIAAGTTERLKVTSAGLQINGAGNVITGLGIDDNATSTAITIDASENVGIGVIPKSWTAVWTAVQYGGNSSIMTQTTAGAGKAFYQLQNAYHNGAWKYISTDVASLQKQESGVHTFLVAPSGTADAAIIWTTAMTIDNAADVTVTTGNLVIGTSGKGIDFSANGNAGGMSSEVLDDYEEGTYTPSVLGSSGSGTWNGTSINYGNYTKVGNVVTYVFQLAGTVSGSSGSYGLFQLPFQIKTGTKATGFFGYAYNPQIGFITSHMYGDQNTSTCYLTYRAASSTTPSYHAPNHFAGSAVQYMGSITYLTN